MSMTPAIRIDRLTRAFGNSRAVDQLSMTVPAGSVFGFLGPNGAGKSTTLRIVLGLLRATDGDVFVMGRSVAKEPMAARRLIGAMIEQPSLYESLSARANLSMTARLLGLPKAEVDRVLEIGGLTKRADQRVRTFSLGMKQRLGIARALLGSPKIVILDEPTNGLDPDGIARMRSLLRRLPAETGATVLVSSHMLFEVEQVATHVALINRGRLVIEGETHRLLGAAQRLHIGTSRPEEARQALAAIRIRDVSVEAEGLTVTLYEPDSERRAVVGRINAYLVAQGFDVFRLATEARSLESLFEATIKTRGEVA